MIEFSLSEQHAQALLAMLGELPTKTGAWILLSQLHDQFEKQKKEQENAVETASA